MMIYDFIKRKKKQLFRSDEEIIEKDGPRRDRKTTRRKSS